MSQTEGNDRDEGQPIEPEYQINIDVETRTVTISYRRPLDIEATEVEVPFAVWKATAAVIVNHEANMEQIALAAGSGLWTPPGLGEVT